MITVPLRAGLSLAMTLLILLVATSPAAAAPPSPGTFVAGLDDRPALNLAIVTDGRRVVAYVCDQGRRSLWFDGRFRGSAATLRARNRRGSIRVRSERRALVGVARLLGRTLRFRALRARGRAGLWRASVSGQNGRIVEATWIVLRNGRRTGTTVTGSLVDRAPDLNTAQPDVQLADRDLTAVQFEPIDLFPFDVAPRTVVIDRSAPQRTGGVTIAVIRDGIADVSGVVVRIDGQRATLRPRDPGSDRLGVVLPGGIAEGAHDVSVQLPGQAELVRPDVFTVDLV
jgi:hypothetical protein